MTIIQSTKFMEGNLMSPKWLDPFTPILTPGINTKNNFVPPKEKGYGEIANCGPVRSHVDHEVKFTPEITKAETEIARCGPVYHGIDAGKSNKYCPSSAR